MAGMRAQSREVGVACRDVLRATAEPEKQIAKPSVIVLTRERDYKEAMEIPERDLLTVLQKSARNRYEFRV